MSKEQRKGEYDIVQRRKYWTKLKRQSVVALPIIIATFAVWLNFYLERT